MVICMIDVTDIDIVINKCFAAMTTSSMEKMDTQEADKIAALFLVAQMKLSFIIENVEMLARGAKNEITRLEGEKYFEYKNSNLDKKITENMMSSYLAKDADIMKARQEHAKYESELKKWNYLLSTLKDGHYYFKNNSKNKIWSE